MVIAAEDAAFALPEVKRGLAAAAGGLIRLPRAIPRNIAMEAVLTGDRLSAKRLFELGFVNILAKPGEALARATELAERIVKNAPLSIAAAKRVIVEQKDWSLDEMFTKQQA